MNTLPVISEVVGNLMIAPKKVRRDDETFVYAKMIANLPDKVYLHLKVEKLMQMDALMACGVGQKLVVSGELDTFQDKKYGRQMRVTVEELRPAHSWFANVVHFATGHSASWSIFADDRETAYDQAFRLTRRYGLKATGDPQTEDDTTTHGVPNDERRVPFTGHIGELMIEVTQGETILSKKLLAAKSKATTIRSLLSKAGTLDYMERKDAMEKLDEFFEIIPSFTPEATVLHLLRHARHAFDSDIVKVAKLYNLALQQAKEPEEDEIPTIDNPPEEEPLIERIQFLEQHLEEFPDDESASRALLDAKKGRLIEYIEALEQILARYSEDEPEYHHYLKLLEQAEHQLATRNARVVDLPDSEVTLARIAAEALEEAPSSKDQVSSFNPVIDPNAFIE